MKALAKHLDLTARRAQQLVSEGVLPRRRANGTFDLDKCRIAYIRYLRDAGRRSKDSDAKTRGAEARTKMLELRAKREEGELIAMTEVEVVFTDIISTLSAELGGVPAASTRDLSLRTVIEGNQNAAIERAKKSFNEKASALQGGRDLYADDDDTVA